MWRRSGDRAGGAAVAEAETLLQGGVVESLLDQGRPVPPWAWLNLLAHGTESELADAAVVRLETDDWRRARSFLAGEILDATRDHGITVEALQRELLIPLELALMDCPDLDEWTPRDLVTTVLTVFPDRGRRPQR